MPKGGKFLPSQNPFVYQKTHVKSMQKSICWVKYGNFHEKFKLSENVVMLSNFILCWIWQPGKNKTTKQFWKKAHTGSFPYPTLYYFVCFVVLFFSQIAVEANCKCVLFGSSIKHRFPNFQTRRSSVDRAFLVVPSNSMPDSKTDSDRLEIECAGDDINWLRATHNE